MDFFRYKQVSEFDVVKQIEKRMELTVYQKEKIHDVIRDLPYRFIYHNSPKKQNPLFRLTVPFFLIYYILVVIAMPVKWIITGDKYYSNKNILLMFLKKWGEKLNF